MFPKIKCHLFGLAAIVLLTACGGVTLEITEAPPRSQDYPDQYLACSERSRSRVAVQNLGIAQLSPRGIENARISGDVIDGCRVATVSSEAFPKRVRYAVTADGFRVRLVEVDQFGFEYVIADPRGALFVGARQRY
jgi:hypothetical protein